MEAEHVWVWFCELAAARGSNGFAPSPIGFLEIEAWARLMALRPTPWEVSTLRRMDNAARVAAQSKKDGEGGGSLSDASDPEQMKAAMRSLMRGGGWS